MQRSCRLLAESLAARPSLDLRRASATLYPPIPYVFSKSNSATKTRLPVDEAFTADYCGHIGIFHERCVLSGTDMSREVTNPVHVMGFLTQWKRYLDELPRDPSAKNFKKLDSTIFEKMSPEQLSQLYELMHATRGVWKPVSSENGVEDSRS